MDADRETSVESPTFSVVIAAYNAEATVAATLRSVLAQDKGDYEVLVIDDGSEDATATVVGEFLGDPRFFLISQENRGLAGARNTAIANARGEFICLLDSDDLWLPDYLSAMERLLRAHPRAAFATCDAWLFDDERGAIRREGARDYQRTPDELPEEPRELLLDLLPGNYIYGGAMIRRAALDVVGPFRLGLRASEDFELWLRLAAHGWVGVRHPERLAVYRIRSNSLSQQAVTLNRSLAEVYRSVVEEYDVDSEVRSLAAEQLSLVETRLRLVSRHRRIDMARLRKEFGEWRRIRFAWRTWYREPPRAIAEAFPDLGAPPVSR